MTAANKILRRLSLFLRDVLLGCSIFCLSRLQMRLVLRSGNREPESAQGRDGDFSPCEREKIRVEWGRELSGLCQKVPPAHV